MKRSDSWIPTLVMAGALFVVASTAHSAPNKGAKAAGKPAAEAAAEPAASPEPEPSAAAKAEAKQVFTSLCATCHGATGKGDGVAAAGLNPKPRAFSDAAWQKSVTDEQIAKAIVEGGAAIGKSPVMPGNPQLKGKPDVVKALRMLIRDLAK